MSSTNKTNYSYTKSEIDSMGGTSLSDTISQKADKSDLSGYLPLDGGYMSGNILKCTNDSYLYVCGGTDYGNGSAIFLYGKDSEQNGAFSLIAHNGTSSYGLDGYPNGALTWNNKNLDVIEEQGSHYIRYSNGLQICWGLSYSGASVTFSKPFIVSPTIVCCGEIVAESDPCAASWYNLSNVSVVLKHSRDWAVSYTAIGRWK